ncbi:ubiquinone anaerobic biosynthesis protein UbiV [Roseibium sediminis]|uniref:ubiquinone anaerobic biosynthesis protein UbiV n=1 Tax=Roseibium sediminis TaxID=1775174 RepID=UPI00123DEE84|nr:U32 family peptidase [Roseibium sediminis]
MTCNLTLGPILFHWPAENKLDFYSRIADEAPIDTVYLGEVICSKRAPFFEQHYSAVVERLERGGKKVVFSSLCEVVLKRERKAIEEFCSFGSHEIEINNSSALLHIDGRPHRIGPMMNIYNEETMAHLASRGASHFVLPVELPRASTEILVARGRELGTGIEIQVFGRASLAVSARCYHARAHGRTKDNCQFVCEEDLDGMPLRTLEGKPFLAINGIQTLSQTYLNYITEFQELITAGITDFRLSPHTCDMVLVAENFKAVLDGRKDPAEADAALTLMMGDSAFSNGFWYGRPGHLRV